MTGDPTTPPQRDGRQQTGGPGGVTASDRTGGVPAVSIVAGVCGLLGFFLGPLLVGDTPDRYLVLALDLVALTAGGVGIRAALGRRARFDYSVLGILTGAVSLGLYVVYVANPPALPAGGT